MEHFTVHPEAGEEYNQPASQLYTHRRLLTNERNAQASK
jgi:hypothetical protein